MGSYCLGVDSPIGRIVLVSNESRLKSLTFSDELTEEPEVVPEILQRTVVQLWEYFEGTRFQFELELEPDLSTFQKNVWSRLLQIPYGETKSYREVAEELGSALNTRAVGTANGKNPISIIVPCHRVVGSDGKMVGYSGGLERKKWLLLHESAHTKQSETTINFNPK